jgi:hypothetical protein
LAIHQHSYAYEAEIKPNQNDEYTDDDGVGGNDGTCNDGNQEAYYKPPNTGRDFNITALIWLTHKRII